ncbi:MAG: hypothetical protein QG652_856 [Pseudomonadota bacterium]|nr:hypothetical protein [Pseudomonadota bacterium]
METDLFVLFAEHTMVLASVAGNSASGNPEAAPSRLVTRHHNHPDLIPGGEHEWNKLLSESSALSVCLHWKWMSLWKKYFFKLNSGSVIITVHDKHELVGIFPLALIQDTRARISKRKLHFFGTGEAEAEEITTEYIDVIAKPGYEQAVCEAIADYLFHTYTAWDVLELVRYKNDSVINKYLFGALKKQGARKHIFTCGYRHYIRLDSTYSDFISARNKSFRRNLACYTNRLDSYGNVVFREITTHDEIDTFIHTLRALHLKRFRKTSNISAFESDVFTSYHNELLHYMLDKDRVLLITCELDNRIIAAEYILLADKCAYAYQGSFDTDIKRVSVGFLSINKAIEMVLSKQIRVFDFMLGAEDSYATSYGSEREPLYTCKIYNIRIYNYLSYILIVTKMHIKGAMVIAKGMVETISERLSGYRNGSD